MPDTKSRCPHLQPLLEAELAAGNMIASVGPSMSTPSGTMVLLRHPFVTTLTALPDGVIRDAINDPHWWKEELRCAAHHQVLACAFA